MVAIRAFKFAGGLQLPDKAQACLIVGIDLPEFFESNPLLHDQSLRFFFDIAGQV